MAAAACGHPPRLSPLPGTRGNPSSSSLTQKILQLGGVLGKGESAPSGQGLPPPPVTLRKVTRVRPEGMAAGKPGSGYYIPSTRAMCKSLNPSLYENYTQKRSSWSRLCPRHVEGQVRPWICRGSPPGKARRSFSDKEDTMLCCAHSSPAALAAGGYQRCSGENERELRSARGSRRAASSSPRRSKADF